MPEEATFGQEAVSWNPKGYANPLVKDIKSKYAELIDILDTHRSGSDDPAVKRLCAVAITEAETASMWAVKSVTWTKE